MVKKLINATFLVVLSLLVLIFIFIRKNDYERQLRLATEKYDGCIEFQKHYTSISDSIFLEYEDSMKFLHRKIEILEAELNR